MSVYVRLARYFAAAVLIVGLILLRARHDTALVLIGFGVGALATIHGVGTVVRLTDPEVAE